ncbi:hypothetical protein [Timonella sp. A28]|uniref:hypothetical protein n=1 Tax=Timonella sp. A28 TaxID=3442640 RepID=UPI003EBBDB30
MSDSDKNAGEAPQGGASPKRVQPEIPPHLAALQQELLTQEAAADAARITRNIEIARLRDTEKISQYRIAKWLGVTERAVMLMAKQGREHTSADE